MKVFLCVIVLATIATAIPLDNAPDDLHKHSAESSENALSEEVAHVVEGSKTQTEDANRVKRHFLFSSWPVVYAAPVVYESPVVYETPVVKTVTKVVPARTRTVIKTVQPATTYEVSVPAVSVTKTVGATFVL